MELISRIELETSPLPRECSTAELYEPILNNQKPIGYIKKYHETAIINDCRDVWVLAIYIAMNAWSMDAAYMERVAGIEPASLAWKAKVLPLYHTRNSSIYNQNIIGIRVLLVL